MAPYNKRIKNRPQKALAGLATARLLCGRYVPIGKFMEVLKTAIWARAFEAAFEIAIRLFGIFVVFIGFNFLLKLLNASSGSHDLLISMLLLPALYVLKDSYIVFDPFTVKAEFYDDKISVYRGIAPRVKDTLEFKNSENIEIITSVLGYFCNYSTVRLYSPGGYVEIPYVFQPEDVVSKVEKAKLGT